MKFFLMFARLIGFLLTVAVFVLLLTTDGIMISRDGVSATISGQNLIFSGSKMSVEQANILGLRDQKFTICFTALFAFIGCGLILLITLAMIILPMFRIHKLDAFDAPYEVFNGLFLLVGAICIFVTPYAFKSAYMNTYPNVAYSLQPGWLIAAILAIVGGIMLFIKPVLQKRYFK